MIGFVLGNICNFTLSFFAQQPVKSKNFIVVVMILQSLTNNRLVVQREKWQLG